VRLAASGESGPCQGAASDLLRPESQHFAAGRQGDGPASVRVGEPLRGSGAAGGAAVVQVAEGAGHDGSHQGAPAGFEVVGARRESWPGTRARGMIGLSSSSQETAGTVGTAGKVEHKLSGGGFAVGFAAGSLFHARIIYPWRARGMNRRRSLFITRAHDFVVLGLGFAPALVAIGFCWRASRQPRAASRDPLVHVGAKKPPVIALSASPIRPALRAPIGTAPDPHPRHRRMRRPHYRTLVDTKGEAFTFSCILVALCYK
jgi:hypothetical protein